VGLLLLRTCEVVEVEKYNFHIVRHVKAVAFVVGGVVCGGSEVLDLTDEKPVGIIIKGLEAYQLAVDWYWELVVQETLNGHQALFAIDNQHLTETTFTT
jgi:hypothetical protein